MHNQIELWLYRGSVLCFLYKFNSFPKPKRLKDGKPVGKFQCRQGNKNSTPAGRNFFLQNKSHWKAKMHREQEIKLCRFFSISQHERWTQLKGLDSAVVCAETRWNTAPWSCSWPQYSTDSTVLSENTSGRHYEEENLSWEIDAKCSQKNFEVSQSQESIKELESSFSIIITCSVIIYLYVLTYWID